MPTAIKKILIVGPSWVGDMVMAQSLFIALQQRHPGVEIDVLAPGWSVPILQRMPQVARSIEMPVGHGSLQMGVRYRLGRRLAEEGYDQAILLPNSLKSALIPMFAGIPLRTGWRGEMRYFLVNDIRLLDKERYPLMVERFVALGLDEGAALPDPMPLPKLVVDRDNVAALRERFGLEDGEKILGLCPGAEFGPAKRWPESHYADVARQMIDRGWRVVLFGSANDHPVAEAILAELSETQRQRALNLAGQTQLSEAVDLLSATDAVVCNDSGLMHVAAALQRPLVVLYGSTSPGFTPPLAEQVEVLQIPVDCGPCFERECPLGHMKCLNDIKPAAVLDALDRLVGKSVTGELQ